TVPQGKPQSTRWKTPALPLTAPTASPLPSPKAAQVSSLLPVINTAPKPAAAPVATVKPAAQTAAFVGPTPTKPSPSPTLPLSHSAAPAVASTDEEVSPD